MLGSVGMTEEEEVVGGRSTSSYTATFPIFRAAPEKIISTSHINNTHNFKKLLALSLDLVCL